MDYTNVNLGALPGALLRGGIIGTAEIVDWHGPSEWISTKPDQEGSAE